MYNRPQRTGAVALALYGYYNSRIRCTHSRIYHFDYNEHYNILQYALIRFSVTGFRGTPQNSDFSPNPMRYNVLLSSVRAFVAKHHARGCREKKNMKIRVYT